MIKGLCSQISAEKHGLQPRGHTEVILTYAMWEHGLHKKIKKHNVTTM